MPLVAYQLANVDRNHLSAHTQTAVTPTTTNGLAWMAITGGTILVGDAANVVTQGVAEWQRGAARVGYLRRTPWQCNPLS
jgi:hypothetical protein